MYTYIYCCELRLNFIYILINTQQGKLKWLYPTDVARGTVVATSAVAGETVHQIFTCSAIHARITGALVDICGENEPINNAVTYITICKIYISARMIFQFNSTHINIDYTVKHV